MPSSVYEELTERPHQLVRLLADAGRRRRQKDAAAAAALVKQNKTKTIK